MVVSGRGLLRFLRVPCLPCDAFFRFQCWTVVCTVTGLLFVWNGHGINGLVVSVFGFGREIKGSGFLFGSCSCLAMAF